MERDKWEGALIVVSMIVCIALGFWLGRITPPLPRCECPRHFQPVRTAVKLHECPKPIIATGEDYIKPLTPEMVRWLKFREILLKENRAYGILEQCDWNFDGQWHLTVRMEKDGWRKEFTRFGKSLDESVKGIVEAQHER